MLWVDYNSTNNSSLSSHLIVSSRKEKIKFVPKRTRRLTIGKTDSSGISAKMISSLGRMKKSTKELNLSCLILSCRVLRRWTKIPLNSQVVLQQEKRKKRVLAKPSRVKTRFRTNSGKQDLSSFLSWIWLNCRTTTTMTNSILPTPKFLTRSLLS